MKNDILKILGQIIEAMRDQDAVNADLLQEVDRLQFQVRNLEIFVLFLAICMLVYMVAVNIRMDRSNRK